MDVPQNKVAIKRLDQASKWSLKCCQNFATTKLMTEKMVLTLGNISFSNETTDSMK